jgi:hypothetical protein
MIIYTCDSLPYDVTGKVYAGRPIIAMGIIILIAFLVLLNSWYLAWLQNIHNYDPLTHIITSTIPDVFEQEK